MLVLIVYYNNGSSAPLERAEGKEINWSHKTPQRETIKDKGEVEKL